jgi:hypothetical protein
VVGGSGLAGLLPTRWGSGDLLLEGRGLGEVGGPRVVGMGMGMDMDMEEAWTWAWVCPQERG